MLPFVSVFHRSFMAIQTLRSIPILEDCASIRAPDYSHNYQAIHGRTGALLEGGAAELSQKSVGSLLTGLPRAVDSDGPIEIALDRRN